MTVSAASADVKLAKKSVSLTIQKSKSGTKYGTVKIKIQSGKGVKIKKVSCKVKKKGVVVVSVKEKNANDVAVLQKIIAEQRALGATISENLDSEQYSWNVEGRLIEIN